VRLNLLWTLPPLANPVPNAYVLPEASSAYATSPTTRALRVYSIAERLLKWEPTNGVRTGVHGGNSVGQTACNTNAIKNKKFWELIAYFP
jgi:hypothetical protein